MALLLATCALLPGCDRNTEPFIEGEEPRQPDLARIFPAPAGDDSGGMPGGGQPEAQGARRGTAPFAGGGPAAGAPAATQAGPEIRGTITLAPELAAAAPPGGMLFLIARPAGVSAGPPLAVLRVPSPSFPLQYAIGPQNVMIPSMRFEGQIQLTARLDSDGNAMTKLPGDLAGGAQTPHAPGAIGVDLVLDSRL